jgi:hypothetical protein
MNSVHFLKKKNELSSNNDDINQSNDTRLCLLMFFMLTPKESKIVEPNKNSLHQVKNVLISGSHRLPA